MSFSGDILSNTVDTSLLANQAQLITLSSDDLTISSSIFYSLLRTVIKSSKLSSSTGEVDTDKQLKIVLILMNQSYAECSLVMMRSFGLNLKAYKESGQLIVVDILTDYHQLTKHSQASSDDDDDDDVIVNLMINTIKENISTDHKGVVMIDDASCLFSLEYSFNYVYRFYFSLQKLLFSLNTCLILQTYHDYDEEDVDSNRLSLYLASKCDIWLECCRLKTGFSDKIDGNLIIHDYRGPLRKENAYQFKKALRNLKLDPI